MAPKDWVTMTLSTVAVIISASTAYFGVLHQTDDVRLVFQSPPVVSKEKLDLLVEKRLGYPIVLINSGNRAAAVSWIGLHILEHKSDPLTECDRGKLRTAASFKTDFDPVVLKEKEVVIKSLRVSGSDSGTSRIIDIPDDAFYRFPLSAETKGEKQITIEACLEVNISTASLAYHTRLIQVATMLVTDDGMYLGGNMIPRGWVPKPHIIVRQSGTIFHD